MAEVKQYTEVNNGEVPLILITHTTYENNIKKAVTDVNSTNVAKVVSVIRAI